MSPMAYQGKKRTYDNNIKLVMTLVEHLRKSCWLHIIITIKIKTDLKLARVSYWAVVH